MQLAIAGCAAAMLVTGGARAEILSSKRGFADVGANYGNLQATGAGWYYTWGTGAANPGNFDANHYPMFWGAPGQNAIDNVKSRNPTYVLGFNEPERSDQANMTVAQAISSWTTISNNFAGTGTRLVSPAVADTGGATGGQQWLRDFMGQAAANNLKVDAVAFHWYGVSNPSNPSGAASSFLSRVDSYWNEYRKPVFITEFAIHDWGGAYTDEQITEANRQFLNIVIPALESRSHVAGYSWYHWFSDARLYGGSPATPTPMAYAYVGAVGAGQVENVGGKNLGEHVAYLTGGELTMTGSTPGTLRYIIALAGSSAVSGSMDWSLAGPSNWVRIQPGATLRKTGSNRITFANRAVTNNGTLEIAQGVLRLEGSIDGSGAILISSTGGATGSTARLELSGRDIAIAQPITFAQRNDPGGSDGIRNVSGSNALTGPITITVGGNQARVQSDAGELTLSGAISTNATTLRNLYLQGAGNGVVSGVISDNAANAGGTVRLIKEGGGAWTLRGANTHTGGTAVSAGRLVVGHANAIGTGRALTVSDGATLLVQAGLPDALDVGTLNVAAIGRIDVNDGGLVIRNGGQAGTQQVTALLKTGLENGGAFDWQGPGISSTEAFADNSIAGSVLYGLGVVQNNLAAAGTADGTTTDATAGNEIYTSFKGRSVAPNDTLVRYTYMGDADLDGSITGTDYSLIDAGFASRLAGWLNGDFDYSGAIDGTDYALIDNAFASQIGPLNEQFQALYNQHLAVFGQEYVDALAAIQSVPEPGTLSLAALSGSGLLARRGRRRRPRQRTISC